MAYRDAEKTRYQWNKRKLFSPEACHAGMYQGILRDFCLGAGHEHENLLPEVRDDAIAYFQARRIPWHDGVNRGPGPHMCCSQSAAVNTWFPFGGSPENLCNALRSLGFPAAYVLPFSLDDLPGSGASAVAFEWIGARNYLGELSFGRVAGHDGRTRGEGFTSADFAFRFRRDDGQIEVVIGEWKYTEHYPGGDKRWSGRNTDRLRIYGPAHASLGARSQLQLGDLPLESLMVDPFDQLMRLQLLASAMEEAREMDADIVSVLHVAPRANTEFNRRITAPALTGLASTVHEVWTRLVAPGRFRGIHTEDLLPTLRANAPSESWARGIHARYGF